MKTLNYGIVSAASIAPRFIGAIQQTEHSKVVAIASRNLDKAQNLANSHKITKVYDNYTDLYTDPEIDVVYICNIMVTIFQYPGCDVYSVSRICV